MRLLIVVCEFTRACITLAWASAGLSKLRHYKKALGLVIFVILAALASSLQAGTLQLSFEHLIDSKLLRHDSLRYRNSAGEDYSSTRLSYLVSGYELQSAKGEWHPLEESVAWIDGTRSRTQHHLDDIPHGQYTAIAFHIGVEPTLNHADPAGFTANHPLNPNLNNLHWNWQGGFIFMALEGHWRKPGQPQVEGYAYHYATDPYYTRIELPLDLELRRDTQILIGLDLDQLLQNLSFQHDGATTHSTEGDPVAAQISENLQAAFRVLEIDDGAQMPAQAKLAPIDLPEDPTPYPISLPSHIPLPALPLDNPIIEERVVLGEKLFHDPILSQDNSISCASCHQGDTLSDPRQFSVGVDAQLSRRHSMPLFNLAWKDRFFWDGRAASLREQVLVPIQDPLEMDASLGNVVQKLSADTSYVDLFKKAFGSGTISPETIGLAIENFLLTKLSFDSKIDQVKAGQASYTEEELRGFELFFTESEQRLGKRGADCFHCHGGALFTDHLFHNNGLPGDDLGLYLTTGIESDRQKFSTPSLRNISKTAPYMHDGRFQTLEEVIEHYNSAFVRSDTLDPNLAKHPQGLNLSQADKAALIAFLKTL